MHGSGLSPYRVREISK